MFSLAFILIFALVGCGDKTKENVEGDVNTEGTETKDTKDTKDTKSDKAADDEKEINEVIVDNENVKATLVKIVKVDDETWGKTIEVVFDVENKRSDSIEVQAREVSADGRMIDETLLTMSQEVAPGKAATAKLQISEYEDYDFPELTSDFEMQLHIFSWDNYDYEEDHPVKVTFK